MARRNIIGKGLLFPATRFVALSTAAVGLTRLCGAVQIQTEI
jgi:hypothetical protein